MAIQSVTTNSTTSSNTYTATTSNATVNTNTVATINTPCWSDNSLQLTVDPYISNGNWLWTQG